MRSQTARAVLASGILYLAAVLAMGREVVGSLGSRIASDAGDPVFTTAILTWNSRTLPWTDAWYDFPAFYPLEDILTFSEHLLGLSAIATPIFWVAPDVIAAYNLTFIATYLLCGLAMYALVWRLTRSAPASFLAGLAYAFAPYRADHAAHIQLLAAFWAPLALLGLHAYLETRRRRWLALFGACWALQGAANGYFLVFFSILIGLWILWFVVAQHRWRDSAWIALAGALALLPLAPILARIIAAHERHGLTRSLEEIAFYSADIASVLCAPAPSSFWGWLNIGTPVCQGERQLFPGVAIVAVCVAGLCLARPGLRHPAEHRAVSVLRPVSMLLVAVAIAMIGAAMSVAVWGPWERSFGFFSVSASSVEKPFTRGMVLLLAAALCAPRVWTALRTASVPWFYGLAAAVTWICSWGPTPTLGGERAMANGPYAWLMVLPGLDGLRVPARFWAMTLLCLSVLLGFAVRRLVTQWKPRLAGPLVTVAATVAILLDGWTTTATATLLPAPPRPDLLRGGVVLTLPLGGHHDSEIAAEFHAVLGGWRSVNGYSGYGPAHYELLRQAAIANDPFVIEFFLRRSDLNVIVYESAPAFIELVEAVPGAVERGRAHGLRQYWIPQQGSPPPSRPSGDRLSIASLSVSCATEAMPYARDGDMTTRWQCGPQTPAQAMTIDLGATKVVGAVVPALGVFLTDLPRELEIVTSTDGQRWERAWEAGVRQEVAEAMLQDPRVNRMVLAFTPRPARFVRLQLTTHDPVWYWSIAEIEVWSGAAGS